jgi:hypothetical protein
VPGGRRHRVVHGDDAERRERLAARLTMWNSEIFSSSGQPASGTPNTVFLKAVAGAFSFKPLEQESLPCSWHQMQ